MKTARVIEAQVSETTPKREKRGSHPNSRANLIAPWKPGQPSANPGGRPKKDVAAEIAQAIFTQNPELIYHSFAGALTGGSAYAFQVLADRGFGKLTDTMKITGDAELVARLAAGRKRAAGAKGETE